VRFLGAISSHGSADRSFAARRGSGLFRGFSGVELICWPSCLFALLDQSARAAVNAVLKRSSAVWLSPEAHASRPMTPVYPAWWRAAAIAG
jgi:hypothetical protein